MIMMFDDAVPMMFHDDDDNPIMFDDYAVIFMMI